MRRGATDLRPVLLGATAWLSMGLAMTGDPRLLVLAGAVAGSVALVGWRQGSWLLVSLALVAGVCVVIGGVRSVTVRSGPLAELADARATATAELRVGGNGRLWPEKGHRSGLWVGSAVLLSVDARGGSWASCAPVQVIATGEPSVAWASVPQGAVVRATVRIAWPDPGGAAFVDLRAREPPVRIGDPDPVSGAVGALRHGLVEASAGLTPDARALIPALVVGDTQGVPDELREAFQLSGLTHLMAVSGANLVLILGFLRAAAVTAGVRGRWLTGVLVGGVAGFVLLCLGEPSVVRAAAMGLVGLAAVGHAGRGRHGMRFLGVAVLAVVLIEPPMALSLGFALSVVATFGLLCWAGAWTDRLARWMPRWCAEALAVPLAAQIATQPIVVALSGQVSVVSVLANLIAGPLVGPATVLGLVATLVAPVSVPLAGLVAWPAAGVPRGSPGSAISAPPCREPPCRGRRPRRRSRSLCWPRR
ncbi:MAG: ComEC/Rec2 family competence protein [Propioniciclava sp.]|uniref:ComEC/Rec2 family competence protein n=1 Tax=Propioniciclava sp. TaxID=2038686 RepID=UPI0039E6593D